MENICEMFRKWRRPKLSFKSALSDRFNSASLPVAEAGKALLQVEY